MNGETCDRCGPAAYAAVSVTFPARSGVGLLTFCDHHAARYVPIIPGATIRELAGSSAGTAGAIATAETAK